MVGILNVLITILSLALLIIPLIILGVIVYNDEVSRYGSFDFRIVTKMTLLYVVSIAVLVWVFGMKMGMYFGIGLWWIILLRTLGKRGS